MKTMIICLASLLISTVISAQTTATWVGGHPGRPSDWTCAYNWSEGRVPDENAQVIIPSDRQYYPIINEEVADIDALLITGGAKLTLEANGSLSILGESGRLDGLTVYGMIVNEGNLNAEITKNMQSDRSRNIVGNGTFLMASNEIYNDVAQR